MVGGIDHLAAFLAAGPATPARFAAWDWGGQADLAQALLTEGRKVLTLAALWKEVAEPWPEDLARACLAVCADRAEAAALLLGPAEGLPVGLAEVAAVGPEGVLALARRIEPGARAAFFRLLTGRRREMTATLLEGPGRCLAVLTMIEGQTGQFALRRGNGLVPLVRLPLGAYGAEVLAWARGATTERFGPNRALRPERVYEIGWSGKIANPRRKIGYDLLEGEVIAWMREADLDSVDWA